MASPSSEDAFTLFLVILTPLVTIMVMGNGLVLYAGYRKKNSIKFSAMRDMEIVIKSLAVNDLLIGLVGFPARILALWMGDRHNLKEDHDEGINSRIEKYT